MNRKSSLHIEKGSIGYCFHNTRQKPTANSIFSTEKNEFENDALKAIEIYRKELKKRKLAYTKRTGKKLHKNTITHLSGILNLEERHTLEDVKKVADYLEKTLGTKVFQIAVHRDEGFIDEETKQHIINYHAHLEMLGLDEEGNSVRRKLTRSYLINLQNEVAKILDMQRGINYTKERKKRPKRLDTYQYKEFAKRKAQELKPVLKENKKLKKENEELKLSKKQLEKEISDLRKRMIEYNKTLQEENKEKEFTQEDYKYLSKLKKELNANNLKEIYEKLENYTKGLNKRIKQLQEDNKDLIEKPEQLNSINELDAEITKVYIKNIENLNNSKKISQRNKFVIHYMYDYDTETKQFDNLENLEEENENFKNKIKNYEEINYKYDKSNLQQIEDYRDNLYLMQILNKRIDYLTEKLEDLNRKIENLAKKVINKLIANNQKASAKFLINKLFKELLQNNQTQNPKPKL